MDKLEEIMRAEDEARHRVAAGREQAETIVRDAEAHARELLVTQRKDSTEQAEALRAELLGAAHVEASRVAAEVTAEADDILAAAQGRMDAAVSVALERLQG